MRKKVSCRTVVGNLRLKSEVKVHEIKGLNGGFQLLNLMSSQECEATWCCPVATGVCYFWKSYVSILSWRFTSIFLSQACQVCLFCRINSKWFNPSWIGWATCQWYMIHVFIILSIVYNYMYIHIIYVHDVIMMCIMYFQVFSLSYPK